MEPQARIGFIIQKRTTLVEKLTYFETALVVGMDAAEAKLRIDRLTTLFYAYEDLHDELRTLNSQHEGLALMNTIQDQYYRVAAKVQTMQPTSNSRLNESAVNPICSSTFIEKQKLLKLPIAQLPTFDGDHNKWISFANKFKAMVDVRTDIDDSIKMWHLEGYVKGEAAAKIMHLIICAENYKTAWGILQLSYERKRILISKHIDLLIDLSVATPVTIKSVSGAIDEVRQNLSALNYLGIPHNPYTIRLLERILPPFLRSEWEKTLKLDQLPALEEFYTFIEQSISV